MARQLQHVVGAAAFRRGHAALQFPGQLARLPLPAFAVAGAAGHIGARAGHFVPEEIGHVVEARVAGNLVAAGGGDHLRDVGVHMQAAQFVAPRGQRIDEALLLEAVAGFGPLIVIGGGREVVEHFGHAAEFVVQDLLHVGFALGGAPPVGPSGHALHHLKRLFVVGQAVHVVEPGHDLVDGVEGRPGKSGHAGIGGARLAGEVVEAVEQFGGKRAEVSAAQFLLALGHSGDHLIALGLGLFVARRSVELRAGRKEVAGEVAAQFGAAFPVGGGFPAAERLAHIARRESGILAEVVQQAVGGEAAHVAAIPFGGLGIHARQEFDLLHGERHRLGGDILAGEFDGRFEGRDFGRRSDRLCAVFGLAPADGLLRQKRSGSAGSQRGGERAAGRFHESTSSLEPLTVSHGQIPGAT